MRKSIYVLIFIMIGLLPAGTTTAQEFEGIIDITISTPSYDDFEEMESVVQRFYIKKPHLRIEVEGSLSDVVILVDNDKQEIYVLDKALRRYTINTFDEYAQEDEFSITEMDFTMRRTGRTKDILGFETQLFEFTVEGEIGESFDKIEVWTTPELDSLYKELFFAVMDNDVEANAWQTMLVDQNLFPLQTKTYYNSSILEKSEVTQIESRSLQKDIFVIPPDYRQVDHRRK